MQRRGALPLLLLAAGCAAGFGVRELNGMVGRGEFAQAAARVEGAKDSYGAKNALLFELDRAFLLQLAGDWAASNNVFEQAKRTAKDLLTKSVTTEASTFLVSDNMRPYYGEDFERALIHVFSAVNYALLGQPAEALVECRQVDFYLKTLQVDFGRKNAHTEDAFARYLAGLFYEDAGEINDAYVSFFKALEAYDGYAKKYKTPRPEGLVADALRTAKALGFRDEMADIKNRWGDAPPARTGNEGELIVLDYNGFAPQKMDSFFEISVTNGWVYVDQLKAGSEADAKVDEARAVLRGIAADKMIRLAVPVYQDTPYTVRGLRASAVGVQAAGALVEDVGAIAKQNLKDRIARTRAKAIARAVVKYLITQKVSEKVEKKNNGGAGRLVKALLQAAVALTETADKRSWRTLPDQILMARLPLPAGDHDVTVDFLNGSGGVARSRTLAGVKITAGRRTYAMVRSAE
ncbi:MAG: hypothetical protein IPP68_07260 [Elusimicrobia bacterium]|nr:hypothetical protein [Elusimicrobiota bacterium]